MKRISRANEDAEGLEQGEYPHGTRELVLPMYGEWDSPLPDAAEDDFVFSVTIPRGKTRREACRIVHSKIFAFMKREDIQIMT